MGLESVTHLDDLDATNPVGTDPRSEGDDHIRNIKSMLLTDFPGISGIVTSTHSELNFVDVTAGTLTASKAIVVDSSSKIDNLKVDNIDINGNTISSTDTNGTITITPHGTGDIILDGQKWPQADGSANYLLKTNGSGQLSWVENLAEDWATKTDGTVASSEYSAKAYAIGGTGVTDASGKGSAKEWATNAEDDTVDTSEYSAKHYSIKGAASASAASTSASTATTKATAAASSATAAASSASAGSTSATASASSATAAASSATAAAASADSFDDLYLGAKSSDPSQDNDGDSLTEGDLYFNSSSDQLMVYTGSAWAAAAIASSGFATLTGSETLTNKSLTGPVLNDPTFDVAVGVTAHTGSAQGNGAITATFVEIATCATTGDAVTLPTAAAGKLVIIANNGAESADVFPASGDKIDGASANAAQALAAGANRIYICQDATDWDTVGNVAGSFTASSTDTLTNKTLGAVTLSGAVTGADQTITAVNLKDYGEVTSALGDLGGGTDAIDLTAGNSVSATVSTGTQTFTFTNPTASDEGCGFTLVLTNGGSQTVNWPASVDWPAATAPTLTASGVDILTFWTIDGGTIWHGMAASLGSG